MLMMPQTYRLFSRGGRKGFSLAPAIAIFGCDPTEAELFEATAPGFGASVRMTPEPPDGKNAALARGCLCASVGHKAPVSAQTLEALAREGVRYLSTRSVGQDHIDEAAAKRLGIVVENTNYAPDGVADYTVMMMLMAVRRTESVLMRARIGDFRLEKERGRELRDLKVGIVGAGRIGRAVIRRLRGFGCAPVVWERGQATGGTYQDLEDLLKGSDVVTLHLPLCDETRHMLDRRRLSLMKPGALLINTARGGLIDTPALVEALENGRLGGAALDVLEEEEGIFYTDCRGKTDENPWLRRLRGLPNVMISPHTAYYTGRALRDTVEQTFLHCAAFERSR